MSKRPKWQHELERRDSQLRRWNRGLGRHLPVPLYVQRWIFQSSYDGDGYWPERCAAELLTEACLTYFRQAPPLPFKLLGGVTVEPPDKAAEVLQELEARAGSGVFVFNGAFAWRFEVDQEADRKRFTDWAADAFALLPGAKLTRMGWPVMVVPTAQWPVDPRLLPGSPVALPVLGAPDLIKRPRRDIYAELGFPNPGALRLVHSRKGARRPPPSDEDDDIPF